MDPEDKKQDEQEINESTNEAKKSFNSVFDKQRRRTKDFFNKIKKKLVSVSISVSLPIVIKILLTLTVGIILAIVGHWFITTFGNDSVSETASAEVISEVGILEGEDGYYFAIKPDLVDTYIRELNNAYRNGEYYLDEEENEEIIKEYEEYKKEQEKEEDEGKENNNKHTIKDEFTSEDLQDWFASDEFKDYFIRMIRAEIASSYPKLGTDGSYGKQEDGTIKKDRINGEIINETDENGNYKAQGIITVKRADVGSDESRELTYLPYEDFKKLSTGDANAKKSPFDYFSFDEEKKTIFYYTYSNKEVSVSGNPGDFEIPQSEYTINESSVPYQSLTTMCSMPYNFLFALLQVSNDPEWVMAVVDQLLLESEATILIQDQLSVTENTETYSYVQKKTTTTTTTDTTITETGDEVVGDPSSTSNDDYDYNYNSFSITTKTTTNTARFIHKVHTWSIDYEEQATLSSQTIEPDTYNFDPPSEPEYVYEGQTNSNDSSSSFDDNGQETYTDTSTVVKTEVSTEPYLSSSSSTLTSQTYSVDVSTEMAISDRFLSTWKNKTGKYELGQDYDATGIEIRYRYPYRTKATSIPPDTISDMSEYGIDLLLDLLARHSDTQIHEELMMYYWNMYTGKDVYDIDVEALLRLFEKKISLKGSLLANFIMAHENGDVWRYITGQTSQIPINYITSDGKNYIVYEDGSGGRHNVSFGMATYLINNDYSPCPGCGRRGYFNHLDEYAKYGLDVKTLCSTPAKGQTNLVPVDIADSAFEDILTTVRNQVEDYIEKYIPDADLTSAQIDCLTSIKYAFGNINGFDSVYNACYKDGEWDYDKLKNAAFAIKGDNGQSYWHPFTEFDPYSTHWFVMFSEGKYLDREGNEILGGAGGEFISDGEGCIWGHFKSESGKVFTIFIQNAVKNAKWPNDGKYRYKNWDSSCNRAANASVCTGYYSGDPMDMVYLLGEAPDYDAPRWDGAYTPIGATHKEVYAGSNTYSTDEIRENLLAGNQIIIWLRGNGSLGRRT